MIQESSIDNMSILNNEDRMGGAKVSCFSITGHRFTSED